MQKEEQLSEDDYDSETRTNKSSDEGSPKHRQRSGTSSDRTTYERDFTQDEVLSSAAVALTFFVGASTALSYFTLEIIDQLYMPLGSDNSYLWIGILFAVNSLLILAIRDLLLPYLVKKEYSAYKKLKEKYFEK